MTTLGLSRSDRMVMWGGFPALGAALGWFVPAVARQVPDGVPWEWAVNLAGNAENWMAALVGAALGAVLAAVGEHETPRFEITDQNVRISSRGTTRTYRREQVHAVRLDGKQLVLEAGNGSELAREKPEGSDRAEEAFRAHGYTWV